MCAVYGERHSLFQEWILDQLEFCIKRHQTIPACSYGVARQVFDQLRENFDKFLEGSGTDLKSECYIPNTVGELVRDGQTRVKVLHSRDSWFGVTYREDRPRVVESIRGLIAKGIYPEKLWPESSRS